MLEPDARRYYVFVREAEVKTVGFCFRDSDRLVGCSPDGLVGDDGVLELKVPSCRETPILARSRQVAA